MAGVSFTRINLAPDQLILSSHVAAQERLVELAISVCIVCEIGE